MGMGASKDDNKKLQGNADFKGPGGNRGCTDCFCSILLIACWAAMTFVGLCCMGFIQNDMLKEGIPARLTNGMDYLGNICGVTDYNISYTGENTKDLSKAYYLPSGAPVCVNSCPTAEEEYNGYYCKYDKQSEVNGQETAAARSAVAGVYMASMECAPWVETIDAWGYCIPQAAIDALASAAADRINQEIVADCLTTTDSGYGVSGSESSYVSSDDVGKYWKDQDSPTNCTAQRFGDVVTAEYMNPTSEDGFFDQANADMYTARWVILGAGTGVAMTLGFVYLYILRIPGVLALVCWGLIALIEACFLGVAYFSYDTSETWKTDGQHSSSEADIMMYVAYGFAGFGGLWFCIICCLRKRIVLAIGIVKEACKAVARMPVITIYPVFQVLGAVIFLVPWCVYMVYLASSGDVAVDCICPTSMSSGYADALSGGSDTESSCESSGCFLYKSFAYSDDMKWTGLYMLFSWFWTSQFIIAAGQLVVAMSISTWYFTRDKSTIGNKTFFQTMKKAMWYHLGTAAFGSLIIAIIKTIRAVIAYLQNQAKKSKNKALQMALCAIQCYMWCLEKCMKFMNKNAYIQTAIYGYSFCKAARKAFFLILRNILRISAVAIVSEFVLIIGKLFITIMSTMAGYYFMKENMLDDLNGLWCPLLLIILFAYVTADMFNEVFGMAIWTILQCFVADEEMFEPAERFAEGDLAACVSKTQKEAGSIGKGAGVQPVDGGDKKMDPVSPGGGGGSELE
ncbi:hypothetical protein TrLO_g14282 [Triparma laevis f. longispina]|uniref:Choline transporter-like protein n=1 Tax=Triparma laevis f. longispina TaxID=1714387 RepID=A0A9W7CLK9_9STRA|nr:hypothetical protein TrLO_g14282 [Triparma laevis f. longispina]